MTVGELFVNIGVKGAEKSVGAIEGVRKGMKEVESTSLAAKAGILGVLYGLQQLMSKSADAGNGLKQFSDFTGLSNQKLQQWQYAARQFGVSSEEIVSSTKAVQNAMSNMLLGKGAPEGMAMLANKVGFDPKKARDTFYVMEQLQKFAQKVPADVGNNMMKSFGLSEGTILAMRKNAFNPAAMAKAPTYNEGEINKLQKVDVAWANLGQKIQMAMGHLNAKHGLGLVGDIEKLVPSIIHLIEAFTLLSEKLQLFKGIGLIFEGWKNIFDGIGGTVDKISKFAGSDHKMDDVKAGAGNVWEDVKTIGTALKQTYKENRADMDQQEDKRIRGIAPKVSAPTSSHQNTHQNANIVVHNHGVKDAKDGAHHVKKEVQNAYRQLNPAAGGL